MKIGIYLISLLILIGFFVNLDFAFAQNTNNNPPPPPPFQTKDQSFQNDDNIIKVSPQISENNPQVLGEKKVKINGEDSAINYSPPKQLKITNWFSYLVGYAINRGVPQNTIILLLMLPIIATIVVFIRQIIGFKTFGIYIPSLVTLVFLSTGIASGLIVFLVILICGTIFRYILKRFRLLYLPRMSILLIMVSLVIFALLLLAAFQDYKNITTMSIFPMLIMIILVEKFINVQIEKGFDQAAKLTLETLAISVIGYFILVWQPLKEFVLIYPGIIFIVILINILIGRWTGLRLVEYFRFKEMLKNDKEDQGS